MSILLCLKMIIRRKGNASCQKRLNYCTFALNIMGRIIAIDYGLKRTGIAVTDPLQITPGPLTTLPAPEVIPFLRTYIQEEKVDLIVVGKAMQTNKAMESSSMKKIRPFVKQLRQTFPELEVVFHDERYTSVLAQQAIRSSGVSKKVRQDKALVDRVSAVIILQSYLFQQQNLLENRLD